MCSLLWADAFDHAQLQLEGGAVQPLFSLSRNFGPTPQVQGSIRFEYSEHISSRVALGYAKLTGWDVSDLHFAHGDVGLDWALPVCREFDVGAGVSLFFVRADPTPSQEEAVQAYQLYDNESEFGWHIRLAYTVWKTERFSLHVGAMYHQIWTSPEQSHLLWAGLGGEFQLW